MTKSASKRKSIYAILDQVIETGVPVEIERKGRKLRISAVEPASKLDRLPHQDGLKCDPEELVHIDWSSEWRP